MDMLMEGYSLIEMKACGHVTEETNVDRSVGITATFEGNRIVQLMCNGGKKFDLKFQLYEYFNFLGKYMRHFVPLIDLKKKLHINKKVCSEFYGIPFVL